jgi:hypothetical protein
MIPVLPVEILTSLAALAGAALSALATYRVIGSARHVRGHVDAGGDRPKEGYANVMRRIEALTESLNAKSRVLVEKADAESRRLTQSLDDERKLLAQSLDDLKTIAQTVKNLAESKSHPP